MLTWFPGCGRQRPELFRQCLREAAADCSLWPGAQNAKTHWPRRVARPSFPQKVAGFYTKPSKKVYLKCGPSPTNGRHGAGSHVGYVLSTLDDPQHRQSSVDTEHLPESMR